MARPLAHRIGIDTIKIAHRGGGNPKLMLSAISLIDLEVRRETPTPGSHMGQKSASNGPSISRRRGRTLGRAKRWSMRSSWLRTSTRRFLATLGTNQELT